MTRINLVPAKMLLDQHLTGEIHEISRIGYLARSTRSFELPPTFRLGEGHVRFFYDKKLFLIARALELDREAALRNFNTECYKAVSQSWIGDCKIKQRLWEPPSWSVYLSTKRLIEKIESKPNFYRYYGKLITLKQYKDEVLRR